MKSTTIRTAGSLLVSLHFHDFYECYLLLSGGIRYQNRESASFSIQPGTCCSSARTNCTGRSLRRRTNHMSGSCSGSPARMWRVSPRRRRTFPHAFRPAAQRQPPLARTKRRHPARQFFALLNATSGEQFGRDVLCNSLAAGLLVTLNPRPRRTGTRPASRGHRRKPARQDRFKLPRRTHCRSGLLDELEQNRVPLKILSGTCFPARDGRFDPTKCSCKSA